MLIFHEGLPGSGKSYEALISHIIPSIQKGRKVFARINGLNYEKIAELTERTSEEVRELLIHVPEEHVLEIHNHVENDSMVIIDELQNFFPSGRQKLSEGITQFVTEHRHRGIDIVTMGQSIADCHNLWKRRTQRKIQFLKLDMVGQDKRYKWTAFQGTLNAKGDIQFTKIKSGTRKYEEKYFGSYASHQAETENTDNYEDDRLNIFKTKTFTVVLPIFGLIVVFAIYYLSTFFGDKPDPEIAESLPASQEPVPTPTAPALSLPKPKQQLKPQNYNSFSFLEDNNTRYESKITYLELRSHIVWDMIVIWYDKTGKVIDRLHADELKSMGYSLTYLGYGVKVMKDEYEALYRFKPRFEPAYSIPDETRQHLANNS